MRAVPPCDCSATIELTTGNPGPHYAHVRGCRFYGVSKRNIRGSPKRSKRHRIIQRDNHKCQYCGRKCSERAEPDNVAFLTLDHIIPLARGGHRTSDMNLCVACVLCNHLKADRMPWEIEMWPLNGLGGCWAPNQAPDAT